MKGRLSLLAEIKIRKPNFIANQHAQRDTVLVFLSDVRLSVTLWYFVSTRMHISPNIFEYLYGIVASL